MKNRDIFISTPNTELDKELLKYGRELKRIVRKYHSFLAFICMQTENPGPQLCWSSLVKASIATQSAIELIRLGYIGSARAIFRQIYEYLLWAKIALDADDDALIEIKQHFFQLPGISHRQDKVSGNVIDYFKPRNKKTPYKVIIHIDRERFFDVPVSENKVIEISKDLYSSFCAYTHASNSAQQLPTPEDDFYEQWRVTLETLTGLYASFMEIFSQHFTVAWAIKNEFSIEFTGIDIEQPIEKKRIQKLLEKLNPEAKNATHILILSFSGKWDIVRRTTHGKA